MKAHVEADDLTAAKAEWDSLPADIKASGREWAIQLDLRIEAFALQRDLANKLSATDG